MMRVFIIPRVLLTLALACTAYILSATEVQKAALPATAVTNTTQTPTKQEFSWDQIKAMIDKDKAMNARKFEATESQWKSAVQSYKDNALVDLSKQHYLTPELLEAMTVVPRPFFAYNYETNKNQMANADKFKGIIDIGWGATMSAPSIQAFMTANLEPKKDDIALEIGTGSGVQAAILSRIVKKVYSIEIREKLGTRVAHTLKTVGYDNVETKIGDGYFGWPEKGPFDIIIVTCQANHIPPELIKQLKPDGRMVIPVGPSWSYKQQMLKVWKDKTSGKIISKRILNSTYFIPMLGQNEKVRADKAPETSSSPASSPKPTESIKKP